MRFKTILGKDDKTIISQKSLEYCFISVLEYLFYFIYKRLRIRNGSLPSETPFYNK